MKNSVPVYGGPRELDSAQFRKVHFFEITLHIWICFPDIHYKIKKLNFWNQFCIFEI